MGDRRYGLLKELAYAYDLIPQGSKRVHWKHPKIEYVIQQLVVDEADEELLVIYAEEGGDKAPIPRARKMNVFLGSIEDQGESKKRFQRVR